MSLLDDLTEAQREAVLHVEGPLLVVAGPGSGKTRVVTYRVANLLDVGVPPSSIVAITFTNKAAEEMRNRVLALTSRRGMVLSTFHSMGARLLREFGGYAGIAPEFSIYDEDDRLRCVKDAMEQAGISPETIRPGALTAGISHAKQRLQMPEDFSATDANPNRRSLAKVYRIYQDILARNNALDFDDLLVRWLQMLRSNEDVRRALQDRYEFILVDEYQDTNAIQYEIAKLMAGEKKNLCVTGDPDQSIYGWRGVDIRNILEFQNDYPGAKVVFLDRNYRSTGRIIQAADALIAHNRSRIPRKLFTENEPGAPVRAITYSDEHQEADGVAQQIQQLVQSGSAKPGDVAVFYRVNALSRVLEEALRRRGLPYRIVRGTSFYERKEIKDVLGYARVLANPDDGVALLRIINYPARGIGPVAVESLTRYAEDRNKSLWEAVLAAAQSPSASKINAKIATFAEILQPLQSRLHDPVQTVLEAIIAGAGIEPAIKKEPEGAERWRNIEELINVAKEFDEQVEGGTLTEFLQQTSLVSDQDAFDENAGVVTLMTLHAAKGLEFPIVFMVGLEEGLLPFVREGGSHEYDRGTDLEEERRLCFVGMTRAKKMLTLTRAEERLRRGTLLPSVPSTFLGELPKKDIQWLSLGFRSTMRRETQQGGWKRRGEWDDREQLREDEEAEGQLRPPGEDFIPRDDRKAPAKYKKGQTVISPAFGRGKILHVEEGGQYTRALINFDDYGMKTLVMELAKIQVAR